jgi:mRNA interferase MazF
MKRGEIWIVQFEPVVGHEQGRQRPALIVSADAVNASPANLVTVLPITSKGKIRAPSRIRIAPPEGGLSLESWVISEQVRTVSKQRVSTRLGTVTSATMRKVSDAVRLLLDL